MKLTIVDREDWDAPDGPTERFLVCPTGSLCDHAGIEHIPFEVPLGLDSAGREAFEQEALAVAARRFWRIRH